jgi:thioredoxin-like negative regulator of GroEL
MNNRIVHLLVVLATGMLALAAAPTPAQTRWETNFETARREAAQSGRPLLVDFYATWCGPCRMMEEQTFSDPAVKQLLARVVCVRLDVDRRPPLATEFEVESIPRVLLLRPEGGRPLLDLQGFRDAASFAQDLGQALGVKGDEPVSTDRSELARVRQALAKNEYAALRQSDPTSAAVGLGQLVEDLGVFKEADLAPVAALVRNAGDDAVPALIQGMGSRYLAVRAGAYRTLREMLRDRKIAPPSGFDPWAPAAARQAEVQRWTQWWQTGHRPPITP